MMMTIKGLVVIRAARYLGYDDDPFTLFHTLLVIPRLIRACCSEMAQCSLNFNVVFVWNKATKIQNVLLSKIVVHVLFGLGQTKTLLALKSPLVIKS